MKNTRLRFRLILLTMIIGIINLPVLGEQMYVDSLNGSDDNPGTKEKPLASLFKASQQADDKTKSGSATVRIAPGIYTVPQTLIFKNRLFNHHQRLVIEAMVLPDDPNWKPNLMPIIISTEIPKPADTVKPTETYTMKIKTSYVTVRGLKFMGNASANNIHACIERVGENLDDLVVSKCMFIADKDMFDIYCPVICSGDGMTVENCIFYKCNASVVFWDGPDAIGGKNHAMRYCIVSNCSIAGPWTCQTETDLEFHHNIVTGTKYFWMRKPGDRQVYKIKDSIVTENEFFSGYGIETGATGQTGSEVAFNEINIMKSGHIEQNKDKTSNYYLHVTQGTFGNELGAGLFTK